MKYDDNVECCANCKWLEQIPRNNRYGDTDNLCIYLGYYCTGIYKDRNKRTGCGLGPCGHLVVES